jgi:polysaccharide export outer membrane protein
MAERPFPSRDLATARSRRWHRRLAAACVLLAALAIPARVPAQPPPVHTAPAGARDSLMLIRPGDVVKLSIWREPDLSGEFPVDEWGMAVQPRIGPMKVTDYDPDSLRATLVAAYEEFLSHSSINVTVLRRVQVIGAVRTPGLYQVDPTMSVSDVLAMAGGATPQGNIKRVELIRQGHAVGGRLSPMTSVGRASIRSGDQLFVPERSWISRNPGVVVASVSAVLSLLLSQLR